MDVLLLLHAGGLGWDEALVVFGGLGGLTWLLLMSLRRREPVAEESQATPAAAKAPAGPQD